MTNSSLADLERVCIRQDKELRALKEEFNQYKIWVEQRLDLRNDLTQQNATAIQTLSIRMDMAGLPK